MTEIKETPDSNFEKLPTTDLRSIYSAEKIEVVPYVTLWQGEVREDECDFEVSNHDAFRTSGEIEKIREELIEFSTKGKTYHDDPKARLTSADWQQGNRLTLGFSRVNYSDYIITNNAMEIKPSHWPTTIRGILEPGPALSPLENSRCSNHLGLSCIVMTKDRKLILQQAGQQKITGAGQITSSASGAMDWKEPFVNPFDVMQAELYEEIGLTHEETADLKAIAIARELARGGKPEMFFLLETDLTSGDILSRVRSDPEKEVERLFTIDVKGLVTSNGVITDRLNDLLEGQNTAQSTKAALFYFNKYWDSSEVNKI